jgi:hypothetical protein
MSERELTNEVREPRRAALLRHFDRSDGNDFAVDSLQAAGSDGPVFVDETVGVNEVAVGPRVSAMQRQREKARRTGGRVQLRLL